MVGPLKRDPPQRKKVFFFIKKKKYAPPSLWGGDPSRKKIFIYMSPILSETLFAVKKSFFFL